MKKLHLKALRELKNYSQSYMASRMGISQSYYSKLENGSLRLSEEKLNQAIQILGVESIHAIFYNENGVLESLYIYQLKQSEIENRIKCIELKLKEIESKTD